MKNKVYTSRSIYPGSFVPGRDEKEISKQLKNSAGKLAHPFISVKDCTGLYEIQVSAPGLEREEFIVYGNNRSLSVDASSNPILKRKGKNFHQNIDMPANADTQLAVAEYRNSVLHVYVPKTKQPSSHPSTRIIVY